MRTQKTRIMAPTLILNHINLTNTPKSHSHVIYVVKHLPKRVNLKDTLRLMGVKRLSVVRNDDYLSKLQNL